MTTWVWSGKQQNRNFAVLEDNVEDVVSELEILKQKIRNLSGGPTSGGHEKCQRKLEKGKSPKGEKAKMKNKKGLEAQDEQHIDQIQVDGLPADQTLLKEKNSLQHDAQPDRGDLGVKTGTRIILLKNKNGRRNEVSQRSKTMQQEEIMDIDLGVGLTIAIEGKLIDGSEIEDRSTTHSTVMEVIPAPLSISIDSD